MSADRQLGSFKKAKGCLYSEALGVGDPTSGKHATGQNDGLADKGRGWQGVCVPRPRRPPPTHRTPGVQKTGGKTESNAGQRHCQKRHTGKCNEPDWWQPE
uniref:Uncharacterized protein n=1 Tax=Eutreptiella gymnastica TaxID=73025 RepID=A0A7S4LEE6_9EUGL